MWDANRSDPGASGMALPGPMRASDSKMMLSLIFAIAALCHPDPSWSSRSFYSVGGADLTRRRIFGRLFPTHRTLLQTAEIARRLKSAGTSFIERRKRG